MATTGSYVTTAALSSFLYPFVERLKKELCAPILGTNCLSLSTLLRHMAVLDQD